MSLRERSEETPLQVKYKWPDVIVQWKWWLCDWKC